MSHRLLERLEVCIAQEKARMQEGKMGEFLRGGEEVARGVVGSGVWGFYLIFTEGHSPRHSNGRPQEETHHQNVPKEPGGFGIRVFSHRAVEKLG